MLQRQTSYFVPVRQVRNYFSAALIVELQIPSVYRNAQTDVIKLRRREKLKRCYNKFKSFFSSRIQMTADHLRWSVQVGVAGGLTSLLCTFLPSSAEFFGSPGVIGTVICVSAIDATTGGSLRKIWLLSTFGVIFACFSFGLFAGCSAIAGGSNNAAMPFLIAACTSILIIPSAYIRYIKPSFNVGSNFGITTAETVLLGTFATAENHAPFSFAYARALSTVVGAICSGLSSQFVMRKAARPTLSDSLSRILSTIAEVLEDLAIALDLEISTTTSWQSLLTLPNPVLTQSSSFMMAQKQELCRRLVGNIQKTQELLSKQRALVESAEHEINWNKPHRFPSKKYGALLNEVRHLFFHVASLVFTLNIYITSERKKLSFDNTMSERQSGRMLPFLASPQNKNLCPSRFRKNTINDELRSPPFTNALFGVYPVDGESPQSHDSALIGTVTRHLAGALHGVAECSKGRRIVENAVRLEIENAAEAIAEMDERRQHQRLAFGEVALNTLGADCKREWVGKRLDFRSALGVSPSAFLKLSESEQIAYWDAYWLQRDRISTSSVTLTTLKDSLLKLCTLADEYVRANSAVCCIRV